ncbi:oxidoreductase [Sphingomonas nostoxanthinifaciens]|uniref:oxidoreductase n=1 Tax=Sphingomonas nostoxanthinifaciens TaxID=2872652 RepID=UPI001CC215E0|nr:oxidoreductase [Sphingomonas nostoxanthinifaciens]UAK25641.1 SDR family NAD(P)-dependent oxidoreductase [Sphingomonas nostoxanthinifaciens]
MSKNWLITGVSGGLGRALAETVAQAGHTVVGTVRRETDRLDFEEAVPGAIGRVLDVTDHAAVATAVESVLARLGRIDVLVNNAGQGFTGAIEETAPDQLRQLMEVNLVAPLAFIQAILPAMRDRASGHIINITSISGFRPWSGTGAYCASKFALEGLGQTLAQEVRPFGIRVTNVMPGGLRTRFNGATGQAAGHIDAYAETAHLAREALNRSDGRQNGDPAQAAQRIFEMTEAPTVPLNLLLGSDAVSMATQRVAEFPEDLGRWGSLSESIDFSKPRPFLRH